MTEDTETEPKSQAEIDEAEWHHRPNWVGGLFYVSEKDSRAWVPKRSTMGRRRMGSTPNLAKREARTYLKLVVGGFALLFLVVILLERVGFLR